MPPTPDPSALSLPDVRKVAKLARLDLSPEQADRYRTQLAAILSYVGRLQALDLAAVEPLSSPIEQAGRLAADVEGPTLSPQTLAAIAPASFEAFVKVPKILGDGGAA